MKYRILLLSLISKSIIFAVFIDQYPVNILLEKLLELTDIEKILFFGGKVSLTAQDRLAIEKCYEFLKTFSANKVIYGINTGFGPMAQYRISDDSLTELQYNIIRSHSCGAGAPLDPLYVKSAMVARLATFVAGKSGVHPSLPDLLAAFINNDIIPYIPSHGSVGASGDLVQLAHLALCLIGEGKVYYKGELTDASVAMEACSLQPLGIYIREGLAVTNGTGVMTGIGLVNLIHAKRLLKWGVAASVLMNEIAASYDDFMSEVISAVKHHPGQRTIAAWMRTLSEGGVRLQKRESVLYNAQTENYFTHKVQPYYSLRCVPQILGPVVDELEQTEQVLIRELNSADDNPIVDPDTGNVYHGGNFHGDYVSFQMDKLKIAVTKMTMLAERQLNYLCNDKINEILPPFLNKMVLGLNYGLQAAQFTATSTTAESQTLSNSMYVHSIPNNNDNQDVVSMGTNSALIARHVISNGFQVMAIHWMALAQAVDCLGIAEELAPETQKLYKEVRAITPVVTTDRPLYQDIEQVVNYIREYRFEQL